MKNQFLKIRQLALISVGLMIIVTDAAAQYKSFALTQEGDTLNIVDKKGLKQGKWVVSVAKLRGEPGYDEEGFYKDDKKTGTWRRYTTTGDIIAIENYRFGGKDGLQEYFSFLGEPLRTEQWRGYNPDAPYDTIPVYGTGNNEIVSFKIVRAEQYSVKHGDWNYYDPSGRISKFEQYDRGRLLNNEKKEMSSVAVVTQTKDKPVEKVKTKEILEYEKKYSKKKRNKMERDGKTGL